MPRESARMAATRAQTWSEGMLNKKAVRKQPCSRPSHGRAHELKWQTWQRIRRRLSNPSQKRVVLSWNTACVRKIVFIGGTTYQRRDRGRHGSRRPNLTFEEVDDCPQQCCLLHSQLMTLNASR